MMEDLSGLRGFGTSCSRVERSDPVLPASFSNHVLRLLDHRCWSPGPLYAPGAFQFHQLDSPSQGGPCCPCFCCPSCRSSPRDAGRPMSSVHFPASHVSAFMIFASGQATAMASTPRTPWSPWPSRRRKQNAATHTLFGESCCRSL